jgi:UPF0271 protein
VSAVDLNCDLGEGFDDDALLPLVTSANVACGAHAGDADTMAATCRAAVASGVTVGAHPSYPDRANFGRVDLDLADEELRETLLDQVAALRRAAEGTGAVVRYLKPHGALYNRIARDPVQAAVVAAVAVECALPLLGPAGSEIAAAAEARDVPFFAEAFADRAYLADGRLAPRGMPGAVIADPRLAGARAVALALHGQVPAIDGTPVRLAAHSLCVHGDTPGAPAVAAAVRAALQGAGVLVRPFR